jgi:thymidylate synthase (FAD)
MIVRLIARPQFIALPPELGAPSPTQLQGSDAEKLIETAGRTCYDSFGKGRSSGDFAEHILESGHGSVLEHAQYSFFISGVSRGLTHELVRHRVGVAISQRSTRYVDESDSEWIRHPLFEAAFPQHDPYTRRGHRFVKQRHPLTSGSLRSFKRYLLPAAWTRLQHASRRAELHAASWETL